MSPLTSEIDAKEQASNEFRSTVMTFMGAATFVRMTFTPTTSSLISYFLMQLGINETFLMMPFSLITFDIMLIVLMPYAVKAFAHDICEMTSFYCHFVY
jgi:hypothetical protein